MLCCYHPAAGHLGNLEFAFTTGIGMALTQINGRVYDASSNRGIEEISVSNGDSIARTDADGRYSLAIEPQQDRYVFISVPEGLPSARGASMRLLATNRSGSHSTFP